MKDARIESLANVLVNYSCRVQPGERVMVEYKGPDTTALAAACCKKITEAGGVPIWQYSGSDVSRAFLKNASEEQFQSFGQVHQSLMEQMDCYIGIRGDSNPFDLSDLSDQQKKYNGIHVWEPVHIKTRLKKRWVVLRYPTASMSLQAEMPTEAFEDFYFQVCTLDYSRLNEAMQPLKALMERTDKVHIVGPGTDLTFSIKDIAAVPCAGSCNIPDGEIFTAPVRNSVNGVLQYNTPTVYSGQRFQNIRFEFVDGKIVSATADANEEALNQILDTDEGARYIGEFALGINPYIHTPMMDILFDEKINGSFHFTPGNAYAETDNGNKSAVHWDLVCIQREEWGGGEIYFDDVLIRKDGVFVHPELKDALSLANLTGEETNDR
jgi:aminopeptidase